MAFLGQGASLAARVLSLETEAPVQPAIFIPIGSPSLLIEDSEARAFIRELGMKYNVEGRSPVCIICISARWTSPNEKVQIMSNPHPQTVHDFSGFADCLYEVTYAADGSVEGAAKIAEALSEAGIEWEFDGIRGYDFGAWSPIAMMFPDASVPILQVSLHNSLDPLVHIKMGEALGHLREEGYLLLCTGGITHNLMELSFSQMRPSTWAQIIDDWVADVLLAPGQDPSQGWDKRNNRLATYDKSEMLMKSLNLAQPTGAYLLPLHVAAGSGGVCSELHRSWIYGNLSMSAYMFGPLPLTKAQSDALRAPSEGSDFRIGQLDMPASDQNVPAEDVQEGIQSRPNENQDDAVDAATLKPEGVEVDQVALNLPDSRPRTSSRPASRELVALATAAAELTDSQRFAQQIYSQLAGVSSLEK